MRKVSAGLFSSLEGVVEAPNEWQPSFDEEMGAAMSCMLDEQDAVLLGRVTYTEWAQYWPTSTDEPFANWINNTPKYVAVVELRREAALQAAAAADPAIDRPPAADVAKGAGARWAGGRGPEQAM
jgi:dihydrofolate reductase